MSTFPKLFLFFFILKIIKSQIYCGIGQIKYNVSFPKKKQVKLTDENYRPIQIHIEPTSFTDYINIPSKVNKTFFAMNYAVKILQKLIKVKPLNYTISIEPNDLDKWGITKCRNNIINGMDTDLIVLIKFIDSPSNYYMSSEPKYIDEYTKRPIVGIINITDRFISDIYTKENSLYYTEILFLHQFTHILGFLYDTFNYFPGGINNTLFTEELDIRSHVKRSYIKTPKVLYFAKKYYGCDNITGVELEDQDGTTNSHWEARTLLGDYMNSEHYLLEQVISEFTLALLEDSGWYKVNYYTGGLMRYGKHQGCAFIYEDCLDQFKNEFFNKDVELCGCSSGRQSRGYALSKRIFGGISNYNRFNKKAIYENADYCLVYDSESDEENNDGLYVGNCYRGNGGYGSGNIYYDGYSYQNMNLPKELIDKYDYNSFCVLSSVSIRNTEEYYKFRNDIIHPMCYRTFCSDKSLTIQIYNHFVVCPRKGGKVQVNGIYEGFLFCPDYNLICTGTVICNDIFDCVEKESLIKEDSFNYDYEIKTNQLIHELINEEIETIVYELSDNGPCPKDCEQCNNLKQCIKCREGFYYIGVRGNETGPIICKNLTDISIGYYEIKDEYNNSIYYPCSDKCDHCNKTHCTQCDNYHKLDENNIFCEEKVKFCGVYENITYGCIKCRGEYTFIGLDRNFCHIINKTKYYTNDDGISYYLCNTSIPHCDECNNNITCEKCMSSYYFLEDNRNTCFNDKNLKKYFTEDDGLSYFPCDKNFNYCDECYGRYNCTKCIDNYYLVNDNGYISCQNIDINKYYKEGIYYYSCVNAIDNCDECDNKYYCNKCINNYFFLKDNRTFCRNDINVTNKYYTNDNGISYYPCNNSFEYCDECINETTCKKCINEYGFFINNYNECIFVGNNKYFSLDGGIAFNFCNSTLPNCDECINNEYCTKCYDNFYFIKNDRSQCVNDKNLSKYYTEDNGITYFPCNEAISFCDSCFNNKSYCVECEKFNGYYFVENDRTICRNDINMSRYYTEDNGISYYPCDGAIKFCEICDTKDQCDKCLNNYFFIGNDRTKCYNEIDFKKYYTKDTGLSYFPCNTSISFCDECFNEKICNKCYLSYILLYENPTECFQESLFINNSEYYKLNETHYKKCSSSIEYCKECNSYNNCLKCEINYYFLNGDQTKCILENDIFPKDEYFKLDENNYYSCSDSKNGIINCKNCQNGSKCNKCKEGYALIYNFFNKCIPLKDLEIGYYHNGDNTIYYPCLENCVKCFNSFECEECSENYALLNDKTLCENCEIKIENINNEPNANIINVSDFINLDKDGLALHYINNEYNYSITIFKAWECTEELWKKNYFKFNTSELNNLINKKLYNEKQNFIYVFKTKNYKNYLEIYDSNGQKLHFEEKCPECNELGFEITNNYSTAIQKEIGSTLLNKIKENNIDIFNKGDKYISNICQNFTISKIDLPIKDRINNLYMGEYRNEIICTDKICNIEYYEISNFSGICNCQINSELNYLNSNYINIFNSENSTIPYEISFTIFKCIKSGFSSYIFSNTGFYLFAIFIFLQILCFIFFLCFEKKNIYLYSSKKDTSNPPKKESDNELLFIDNFDILDNINDNLNNISCECSEKQIQEKDDGDEIEDIHSFYVNFEESTYNNKDKESTITDIKSETEISNNGKRKSNTIKDIKQELQETNNAFLDEKEENNIIKSKKQKRLIKDKKYKNMNKSDINLKYKDILSLNIIKKQKNQNKKSDCHYANTEGNERINKLNLKKKFKPKNPKNKIISETSAKSKEELIDLKDKISSIKKSILGSPDNISFEEAKASDNLSFCGFYWYLLGLKQPLLNLASQIKMFKITESFVPSGIKLIRFIFILGLNFFVNGLFISQKYYSEKYKYFDNKYNLKFTDLEMDISTNERFSYAFKHTILFSVYSFIICYVIQAVISFFYFNLRKRINMIISNDCNVEEEIKDYLDTVRIKYKFMFMINMMLMILFGYYIINFSVVYRGGDLDYIAAAILTFVFLQIFPFFVCFVLAIFRYCGLKKSEQNIYKFSQIFAY